MLHYHLTAITLLSRRKVSENCRAAIVWIGISETLYASRVRE
jgi:hypothetical protein